MNPENLEQPAPRVKVGDNYLAERWTKIAFDEVPAGAPIEVIREHFAAAIRAACNEACLPWLTRIGTLEKLCQSACEAAGKYLGIPAEALGNVEQAMGRVIGSAELTYISQVEQINNAEAAAILSPVDTFRRAFAVQLILKNGIELKACDAVAFADALIEALGNPPGFFREPPEVLPSIASQPSPTMEAGADGFDAELESIVRQNAAKLAKGPIVPVQPLAAPVVQPGAAMAGEVDTTRMTAAQRGGSPYGFSNR